MRTAAWIVAAASLAVAALVAPGSDGRANPYSQEPPTLRSAEGSLARTWFEFGFANRVPRFLRVSLVESGVPVQRAQHVPVRLSRSSLKPGNGPVAGRNTRRLVAERTYDIEVRWGGGVCAVLPAAFTAHAPRLTLSPTSAARGETVRASLEFASPRARFRVGSIPARLTSGSGYGFEFEVPRELPPGVRSATVTAETAGRRVAADVPLTILPKRRVLRAVVDGRAVTTTRQSYAVTDHPYGSYWSGPPRPLVYVSGERSELFAGSTATQGFRLRIPVDLATATLPLTVTGADGAELLWGDSPAEARNGNVLGSLPGPDGSFRTRTDVTVTLESIEGTRIKGTFSAHVVETDVWGEAVPSPREFDVADGRFEVDPE